jgi:hypothetical protein
MDMALAESQMPKMVGTEMQRKQVRHLNMQLKIPSQGRRLAFRVF